ncbi:hypothetical protein ABMA58_19280, partial [Oceanospirillum sp. HFRX-1_2]
HLTELLPLEMDASGWRVLVRAVVSQQMADEGLAEGVLPDFVDFDVYGTEHFTVVIENETEAQQAFTRTFGKAMDKLFRSDEDFVQTAMSVRRQLLAES